MKRVIIPVGFLLLIFITFSFINSLLSLTETKVEKKSYTQEFEPVRVFYTSRDNVTTLRVPAVDKEGRGVMATLTVETRPGVGRTLVDIDQISFWVDTQDSIRTAKVVARNITGIDFSKYDIIYSIQANASMIGGPSAGAAMAIATILELKEKGINESVTITGTLDENGNVGKVSGILAKARAAKEAGMSLFLVPPGQGSYTTYEEEKSCEDYIITKICRSVVKPKEVDVEEEIGIKVEEVSTVEEALKYFLA